MTTLFELSYSILIIFAFLGILQLYWGTKLMQKYKGDPTKEVGRGGPFHYSLIMNGVMFVFGSLIVVLIKLISK